jgi:DNA-binding CsgD family transcriptional regulator
VGRTTVGRSWELTALRRHLDGDGRAAVLVGPAGVGKSHLVRLLLDQEADRGRDVVTAVGSPSLASVPFAVVAELVPPEATGGDPLTSLQRSLAHVADRAANRPMTVAVDDAHLLDAGSLALVRGLADVPGVRTICTVRAGEPVPSELDEPWKDRGALRLDLAPLHRADADQLAASTLGGPPEDATAETLWTLAQGNPLYLRELLLGARDRGQLERHAGRWRLTEHPGVTPRLVDLVSRRLRDLDAEARRGLDALAVLEPLAHTELVALIGTGPLARLEAAGLVTVTASGRRHEVRFGRPVHGEVVRATLPHARRIEVADLLLDVLADEAGARRGDQLRLAALWRLAGRPGRPELFVAAAREALAVADLGRARELAALAVERDGGVEAQLTHGEVLVYLGGGPPAEAALAAAVEAASTDAEHARVALLRFHDHAFNRGELAQAVTVVAAAHDRVTTPLWRDQLAAAAALGSLLRADLRGALDAAHEVLAREEVDPRTLLGVLVVTSLVHVLVGDVGSAMQELGRAQPLVEPLRHDVPLAGDQLGITEVLARWHDAHVDEAVELARERDLAARGAAGTPSGAWGTALALALVESGQLEEAAAVATDAAVALEVADPLGLRSIAVALAARSAAGLGELDTARRLVDDLAGSSRLDVRGTIFLTRARAWLLAAEGDLAAAVALVREQGEAALATDYVVWGATLLHDAVRYGAPDEVGDTLRAAARAHGCALLLLYAQHATALADGDLEALRRVAQAFAAGGFALYAAEAMAQAAEVAARAGAAGRAASAATAAGELLRRCGPRVTTPALVRAAEPLTPREREVALLAGAGATSREVAARLGVSVRTVDNHLASIYRKAGIGGRHELGELFADPGAGQR